MAVELKAVAKLDGAPFERNVKKMGNSVDKFKTNQLAGLKNAIAGAFAIGGLIQFGRKLLKTADDLQTAANIFGTTIETMIAFQNVMAESGIGAERFNKIFGRIASAQTDVRNNLKTYIDALKEMNISADEFKNIGVDKVLELMATRYGEVADKQKFVGGLTKLLGARVVGLIEVFQRMNKGMGEYRKEAEEAAEGMRALAEVSDLTEKIGNKFITWGASVVGILQDIADLADAASLAMQGVISVGDIFGVARGTAARRGAAGAGGAGGGAGGGVGGGGGDPLAPTAADNKWYKLMEEKTLRRMNLTEKIAFYEHEISALQKARAQDPTDLTIASDVLEREKKVYALKQKQLKLSETQAAKLDKLYEAQDKLAMDFTEKRAGILSGKGIEMPSMARVDPLQAIGGLIGGVAGKGDQAARIAERQTKTQEAMERLMIESNRKLEELNLKMDGIID